MSVRLTARLGPLCGLTLTIGLLLLLLVEFLLSALFYHMAKLFAICTLFARLRSCSRDLVIRLWVVRIELLVVWVDHRHLLGFVEGVRCFVLSTDGEEVRLHLPHNVVCRLGRISCCGHRHVFKWLAEAEEPDVSGQEVKTFIGTIGALSAHHEASLYLDNVFDSVLELCQGGRVFLEHRGLCGGRAGKSFSAERHAEVVVDFGEVDLRCLLCELGRDGADVQLLGQAGNASEFAEQALELSKCDVLSGIEVDGSRTTEWRYS